MPNLSVAHQTADRFELQVRGHRLLCDQPPADGGDDQGPTPTELFVGSLAACVAFYARRFLARHDLDAAGLRVEAAFTMSPDRPARVDTITLRLLLPSRWRRTAAGGCWRSSTTAPSTTPSASHPRCTSRWPRPPAPAPRRSPPSADR
jgi:OsmC-like protein